jgi:hypothetical protein
MNKKVLSMFLLLASLLILVSCIEFEHQTMTYAVINGDLLIFQEYEGIYGADNTKILTGQEKQELDSVLNGGRTFFFANWIGEYHRKVIEEALAKCDDQNSKHTAKELASIKIQRPLLQYLLKNVKVTNGKLYYNHQGQLSGYQTIKVTNIKQLITLANKTISKEILVEFNNKNISLETKAMITAKAKAGFQWLKIIGNKIIIEFPMTADDYKTMQADIKKDQQKNKSNNNPMLQLLTKNLSFSNSLVTSYIGADNNIPVVIRGKVSEPYHDNAATYLAQKTSIEKGIDLKQLKQDFFSNQ